MTDYAILMPLLAILRLPRAVDRDLRSGSLITAEKGKPCNTRLTTPRTACATVESNGAGLERQQRHHPPLAARGDASDAFDGGREAWRACARCRGRRRRSDNRYRGARWTCWLCARDRPVAGDPALCRA